MWLFMKESLLNTEKWAFAFEFSSFCLDKFQKKKKISLKKFGRDGMSG